MVAVDSRVVPRPADMRVLSILARGRGLLCWVFAPLQNILGLAWPPDKISFANVGREAAMLTYRAYIWNQTGHFLRSHNFQGTSDGQALLWGCHCVDGHDVELWEGERLVRHVNH
jgi:hypothetical protein